MLTSIVIVFHIWQWVQTRTVFRRVKKIYSDMSKRFTSERILTSQGILLTFVRTYRHLREYEIVNNHNLKNQLPALWQNQWPFDQPITDGDLTTYYEKLRTHRYANVVAVSSSHHHISVDLPAGVTLYSPVIHRV